MRSKITVVGAGNVGSTLASRIAERGNADVVLVDIVEGLAQGKALDISQCGPILGFDSRVTGTNNYEATRDSDIAVITSGVPRKPGMSRDDLVLTNMNIVRSVTEQVARFSPDCIILVVANPLDAMTQLALKVSGFSRTRVFGQSGVLDTARFRTLLARELNLSVTDIEACVLGGHGDTMVAIPRLTTAAGIPITELLSSETIAKVVERTVKGGAEIVSLLRTGSAYYAPAVATELMIDAILTDRKKVLPCAAYLDGEYGIKGVVAGVPVKLGRNGIEKVIELKLTAEETEALKKSAAAVRELMNVMKLG